MRTSNGLIIGLPSACGLMLGDGGDYSIKEPVTLNAPNGQRLTKVIV
jgi:hypothetical protein